MAVEARHLNLFSPQLISNREMMNPIDANMNLYNTQMGYSSLLPPLSGTTTATETLLPPPYNTLIAADSLPQKTAMKSDSGLTYNVPLSRKRSRDTSNSISYPFPSYPTTQPHNNKSNCGSFSFLGEDISLQIHQQQLDIDHLITQRMEKVRLELEEKWKRQARRIIEAIEVGVMKRLKAKEDEIEKIGKLNWALEERVKSLCIENQIWRELAQTNEATANVLRTNLEQILAQRGGGAAIDDGGATVSPAGAAALMDDAQSCCGSTEDDDEEEKVGGWRTLMGCVGVKDKDVGEGDGCTKGKIMRRNSGGGGGGDSNGIIGNSSSSCRMCRSCAKEESCVLILPCRHLCLCTVCGSTLHTCPICKSSKTGSVHVNMS